MRHTKVAIIGAGAVGSTTAYALILKGIAAEIMLIDIDEKRCTGEILDLSDALPFSESSKVLKGTIADARTADIIIICAGVAQKPDQSRLDLTKTNKKIVTSIIKDLQPIGKNTIVMIVTNPVDVMTFFALKESGLPENQLFGTGTFLDTQRVRGLLSKKLNIAEQSIHAYVLGEHGDSQFPAWSSAEIAGTPITDLEKLDKKQLDKIAQETKNKAYEIIKCKGATYFGIAACVSALCENILFDQKRIAPVSTFNKDFGVCLSMPAVIGANGAEKIIKTSLNQEETKQLELSAKKIKETIEIT